MSIRLQIKWKLNFFVLMKKVDWICFSNDYYLLSLCVFHFFFLYSFSSFELTSKASVFVKVKVSVFHVSIYPVWMGNAQSRGLPLQRAPRAHRKFGKTFAPYTKFRFDLILVHLKHLANLKLFCVYYLCFVRFRLEDFRKLCWKDSLLLLPVVKLEEIIRCDAWITSSYSWKI